MKTFFLFVFILFSGLLWAQNPVVLKVRLYQPDKESQISFQKNEEAVIKIGQNEYRNIDVKLNDVLSFFVNNELIEHIEISQNIIDRKSLNLVITGSEVLDELEIEYTDLNAMLGMKGERYTRAERAVMKDNQLTDSDAIEANVKLDGLINKITGRAKLNKKVLEMEKELVSAIRFLEVYPEDYLFENYKLPKDKAPYFALQMVPFINANTKIDSPEFKELMEQQLLHFDYED